MVQVAAKEQEETPDDCTRCMCKRCGELSGCDVIIHSDWTNIDQDFCQMCSQADVYWTSFELQAAKRSDTSDNAKYTDYKNI